MAKRVAILMGGWSAEREVSLVSGRAAADALSRRGYDVIEIDVHRDLPALLAALDPLPDVAFNALHGRGGEDGIIQSVLEILGLPYTHSGPTASAMAMDKPLAKRVVAAAGVQVVGGELASAQEVVAGHVLKPPYVVKPACEGSSVGVHIVHEGANAPALNVAEWSFGPVLVEPYIPGRELTVGVMGDRALSVTEIQHSHGFFDYEAKYTAGHAEHVLPAEIPDALSQTALDWALAAHRALGCTGISRSDFRWDDGKPGVDGLYFLEINTQPGFTPISLIPEQAQTLGISFEDLCTWLVETAQCHA